MVVVAAETDQSLATEASKSIGAEEPGISVLKLGYSCTCNLICSVERDESLHFFLFLL